MYSNISTPVLGFQSIRHMYTRINSSIYFKTLPANYLLYQCRKLWLYVDNGCLTKYIVFVVIFFLFLFYPLINKSYYHQWTCKGVFTLVRLVEKVQFHLLSSDITMDTWQLHGKNYRRSLVHLPGSQKWK